MKKISFHERLKKFIKIWRKRNVLDLNLLAMKLSRKSFISVWILEAGLSGQKKDILHKTTIQNNWKKKQEKDR